MHELPNDQDVILTWVSGQTLTTSFNTFVDNWDTIFYPSSDDIFVIDENWKWVIYLAHFERFQIGRGINFLSMI